MIGGIIIKSIAEIIGMAGFFFCSYLAWLIFKQKYDTISEPNQGGFLGFNDDQNPNPNPGFIPFAGRATSI